VSTWGLTGTVAAGKSTVAQLLSEEGIGVVDADEIARSLRKKGGQAYDQIEKRFGTTDRKKIREIIFSDPKAQADLESILHPLIQKESAKQIAAFSKSQVVVYEAALLIETGRYLDFEGLILVDAPKEIRLTRLMKRDQISRESALKMIDSQLKRLSDSDRRGAATIIIENDGSLEDLRKKIKILAATKDWRS
jgi:dephospho-CoA kinase